MEITKELARSDADVASLLETVRARSQALIRCDIGTLMTLLDDDFVYVNAHGRLLVRDEYVKLYLESGALCWTDQTLSEERVRIHGDTGVVNVRVHDRGRWRDEVLDAHFRSMQVYVRREGTWKCVAIQTTAIEHPITRGGKD